MSTAQDILNYARSNDIQLATKDGQLVINAPKTAFIDEFLISAKQHKVELLEILTTSSKRWNPELSTIGYVWCFDCIYWNDACSHPKNYFRKQCGHVPRKCHWFEVAE